MGRLLGHAIAAQQWLHHRAFEAATRDPEEAQARVLRTLLRDNADTVFGREHGFATIGSAAEYAQRVPIRDYEALRPYVGRITAGEPRVLTAEPPFMFTTTSGTTGEPKFIPVTAAWAHGMASLMRLWTFYALRDHPGMLGHRVLTIVGPATEGVTTGGLPYGAMTGLTYQRLPWLIRRQHALPYAAALIRDHETRYFVALRMALERSISSIGTPNPSTLLRLADIAARRGDEVIRAIHDGTLGVTKVEPMLGTGVTGLEIRAALAARLRPNRQRAALLAGVAGRRNRLVLGDCWPELSLVACWLGGSAGIQARHLEAHFGPQIARRDLGLVASEGRFTIPVEDDSAAGVLAVHSNFYEFVAEQDIDDPAPRRLLCHELAEGRRYYLIVTGANGLYRYDLNDVVEVRGFHERTQGGLRPQGPGHAEHHRREAAPEPRPARGAGRRAHHGARRLAVPPDPGRRGSALRPPGRAALLRRGREHACGFRGGVRSRSRRSQYRVRVQACFRTTGAAAALRHAPGLVRAALPGGVRARPARDSAQVERHASGVGRHEPGRGPSAP